MNIHYGKLTADKMWMVSRVIKAFLLICGKPFLIRDVIWIKLIQTFHKN